MTYIVAGIMGSSMFPGETILEYFTTFEAAVDFIKKKDSMGYLWVRCPDLRWYNPTTDEWRLTYVEGDD